MKSDKCSFMTLMVKDIKRCATVGDEAHHDTQPNQCLQQKQKSVDIPGKTVNCACLAYQGVGLSQAQFSTKSNHHN